MQIGSNNNLSFTAKMYVDKSVQNPRFQQLSKEITEQTKSSPDYEIRMFQEGDKFEVYIDRGKADDLSTREFLLTEEGSNALSKLSDKGIVQKFKKMLNLVKANDKVYDNLYDDVAKLEKKYDIEFSQGTYDNISYEIYQKAREKAVNKVWDDSVLSDARATILQ